MLFQRCYLKHLPPYGPTLTKNEKKLAKIQNFTTLVETLPRSMQDFFGSESDVYFQGRCCLKFFLPCGAMLMKMKNNCKNQKNKILKNKNKKKKIVWRYGG